MNATILLNLRSIQLICRVTFKSWLIKLQIEVLEHMCIVLLQTHYGLAD
jgi:hypothetical protein